MNADLDHRLAGRAIEGRHEPDHLADRLLGVLPLLRRGRDDPEAERLREDEDVASLGAGVRDDTVRVDEAGDREAVDRLVGLDRVPADDVDPGLLCLVGASLEDPREDVAPERDPPRTGPTVPYVL
jgi:hypothetical protein